MYGEFISSKAIQTCFHCILTTIEMYFCKCIFVKKNNLGCAVNILGCKNNSPNFWFDSKASINDDVYM